MADLNTFRLRCRHCEHVMIAEVGKWNSLGGHGICPKCKTDWGNSGVALASLMAGLKTLCVSEDPDVVIQIEIADGHGTL